MCWAACPGPPGPGASTGGDLDTHGFAILNCARSYLPELKSVLMDEAKAKQAASDLVAGQTVTIEKLTTDRYGRTIGRVFVNGLNVNRSLVEGGNCWVYPRYAKDKVLFTLQDQAQKAQRGLWALPQAERVPPWKWRRTKR